MIKTIDQRLFDEVYKASRKLGYETYPFLPIDDDVPYPFVVMGDVNTMPMATMSTLLGTATMTVHLWGKLNDRATVSMMASKLREAVRLLDCGTRRCSLNIDATQLRLISDTTTDVPLWHGVLELEFKIHK